MLAVCLGMNRDRIRMFRERCTAHLSRRREFNARQLGTQPYHCGRQMQEEADARMLRQNDEPQIGVLECCARSELAQHIPEIADAYRHHRYGFVLVRLFCHKIRVFHLEGCEMMCQE